MRSQVSETNPITRDFQNVVSDAQELLKTVQSEGESRLSDAKGKLQAKLGQVQASVQDGAKAAVEGTDTYVRKNPWIAVGVSAAVGAVIGFLMGRR